jgi:hypothetical protein
MTCPRSTAAVIAAVVVTLVVAALPLPAAALETTAAEILKNPERFDQQAVTLRGTMSRLDVRTSRKGNPYYTFTVQDLPVFSFGMPPCRNGAAVTVDGVFRKIKQVGRYTFHNEIDADQVVCR